MELGSKSGYCTATYRLYDEHADFHKKAQGIAVGLTVGSWTELPETRKQQMQKHLGQVVSVEVHEEPGQERFADIMIAYPDANFSADLPALLVTVFGKLSMDGRIKLKDLTFSKTFLSHFQGPKFGVDGVRRLLGVQNRPLLMSIFKSVIGHDLSTLREQFLQQALGGVDLIKDDEILFENSLTPIEKRVKVCMQAAQEAQDTTGQQIMYAVNLTGHTFNLIDQAKRAIDAGANALLFNVFAYGLDVLHALSTHPDVTVPIVAHPAVVGAFISSPYYGIESSLMLGKLLRLAGADLVLFPSPYGSVVMPFEENIAIRDMLLTKDAGHFLHTAEQEDQSGTLNIKASFPVPSAGIHPGLVPLIVRDFGYEVVINAGGGVHGHPMGAAAGGQAFRQAIEAVCNGTSLQEACQSANHKALQIAIEKWGVRS